MVTLIWGQWRLWESSPLRRGLCTAARAVPSERSRTGIQTQDVQEEKTWSLEFWVLGRTSWREKDHLELKAWSWPSLSLYRCWSTHSPCYLHILGRYELFLYKPPHREGLQSELVLVSIPRNSWFAWPPLEEVANGSNWLKLDLLSLWHGHDSTVPGRDPSLTLLLHHWRLLTQVWAPSPGQAMLLMWVLSQLQIYQSDLNFGCNKFKPFN